MSAFFYFSLFHLRPTPPSPLSPCLLFSALLEENSKNPSSVFLSAPPSLVTPSCNCYYSLSSLFFPFSSVSLSQLPPQLLSPFPGQLFLPHCQCCSFLLLHHHQLILSTLCPPHHSSSSLLPSFPPSSPTPPTSPFSFPGEVSNNGSDGVREGGAIIVLSGVRGIDRPRNMRREKEPLCQIQ